MQKLILDTMGSSYSMRVRNLTSQTLKYEEGDDYYGCLNPGYKRITFPDIKIYIDGEGLSFYLIPSNVNTFTKGNNKFTITVEDNNEVLLTIENISIPTAHNINNYCS